MWDAIGALTRGPDGSDAASLVSYTQRRLLARAVIAFVVAPAVLAPFAWQWNKEAERALHSPCRQAVPVAWLAGHGLADAEVGGKADDHGCHAHWEAARAHIEIEWRPDYGDFDAQRDRVAAELRHEVLRWEPTMSAVIWPQHATALVRVGDQVLKVHTAGDVNIDEITAAIATR